MHTIHILLIEDSRDDIIQIREYLADTSQPLVQSQFVISEASTLAYGLHLLKENGCDIVLLDLRLPDSAGAETFRAVHASAQELPIILLTHTADEALAVQLLREGAQDYLFKNELRPHLLHRAVQYALQRFAILDEKRRLIGELECALSEVKRLQGMLPICSHCKKIRTDDGFWKQVDQYVSENSETRFTHGLCPDCARRTYTEHYKSGE